MENDGGESGGGIEFTGEVQSVGDDDLGLGFDRHLPHHILSDDGAIANNVATFHSLAEAKGLFIHTGTMTREIVDGARSIFYFVQHCRRPQGWSSRRDGCRHGG